MATGKIYLNAIKILHNDDVTIGIGCTANATGYHAMQYFYYYNVEHHVL